MIQAIEDSEFRFLRREHMLDGVRIPFFCFSHLQALAGFSHGVFTRRGGVSPSPCCSLNVSVHTSDAPSSVRENLERVRRVLGADRLVSLEQAHGRDLVTVREDDLDRLDAPLVADGIMTDVPGLGLLIKQADCQAVILMDPVRRAVANIHCGWRGHVAGILGAAVARMQLDFGSRPENLLAGVGPSLGPCCGEFKDHESLFPRSFRAHRVRPDHFDLWSLSRAQLAAAGLRSSRVGVARLCTRCRTDLFFSYRAEGDTGRFAAVAMLAHSCRARGPRRTRAQRG